jgi:hypothetical protein
MLDVAAAATTPTAVSGGLSAAATAGASSIASASVAAWHLLHMVSFLKKTSSLNSRQSGFIQGPAWESFIRAEAEKSPPNGHIIQPHPSLHPLATLHTATSGSNVKNVIICNTS